MSESAPQPELPTGNDPFADDFGPTPGQEPVPVVKPVYDSEDHRRLAELPRMGIMHLIALTTGIAICFAVSDYQPAWQAFGAEEQGAVGIRAADYLPRMLNAFSGGLAIGGLFWLGMIYKKADKFCISPGHYILAIVAVQQIAQILQTAVARSVEIFRAYETGWAINLVVAMVCTLVQIFALKQGFKNFKNHPLSTASWRYAFGCWLVFSISFLTMYLFAFCGLLFSFMDKALVVALGTYPVFEVGVVIVLSVIVLSAIAVFFAMIVAPLNDIGQRKPRDWVHHCGIAAYFLAFCLIPIINFGTVIID